MTDIKSEKKDVGVEKKEVKQPTLAEMLASSRKIDQNLAKVKK